jgi:hypothetical protein
MSFYATKDARDNTQVHFFDANMEGCGLMRLTQAMVKELLPFLAHFAETGHMKMERPSRAVSPESERDN